MSYFRSRTFRPSNGCFFIALILLGLYIIGSVIVHVVAAFVR
jgi:hypothetical protein